VKNLFVFNDKQVFLSQLTYCATGWTTIPGRGRDFSFLYRVQIGSGDHTALDSMGNSDNFAGT